MDALQQATMRRRQWRESTEREAAAARAAARGMRRKERAYKRMLPQARRGFLEARRGNSVLRYVNTVGRPFLLQDDFGHYDDSRPSAHLKHMLSLFCTLMVDFLF